MCSIDLEAVGRVPDLIELLGDLHGESGQPHGKDQGKLGQVELDDMPPGLPQSMEYTKPKHQQGKEERWLENWVQNSSS